MNKLMIVVFGIFFLGSVSAREVINQTVTENVILYNNIELDPAMAYGIGAVKGFDFKLFNRRVMLSSELSIPLYIPKGDNYRLSLTSRVPLYSLDRWKVINRLGFLHKKGATDIDKTNSISIEEGILAGYFTNKYFLAFELNYEKYLLTRIKPNSTYRKLYYSDAKTGWYKNTGGKISLGGQLGYDFSNGIGIGTRIGIVRTEKWNEFQGVPLYVNLTISYSLK